MFCIAYVTMRIIFCLAIICSCALAQEATNVNEKMDVFRLPNDTVPLSYNLKITPIIDPEKNDFSFNGDVTIHIRAKTSTEELTLNARDLKINSVDITDTNSSSKVETSGHNIVAKNEQLKIQINKPGLIADREYDVQIKFSGELRNDMTGFYKSSYTDKETKGTKWLAVTQFEPTYARRAFPCYDEPGYKTPFKIFITRRDTQISLSNMQKEKEYQVSSPKTLNYICDQYPTTDPIATYLVAFSVSEFVNATKNQRIYVYTHKDYIDQVSYIDEKAEHLLNMMEIYTGIQYPYSKISLLALPDFSYGAMENWGLNTYREKYLLVNEKSSEKDKETVLTTVQHELAHQWFGDLVTCSSWNYVWLNEAFATVFEYFAIEVEEPKWRIADMFIIEQHQAALGYDQRPKHPITASVNTPSEIEDIFDLITYNKGASVLIMLKNTMNEQLFRTSLSSYLNTYKYKSVEPKNLWDSFDSVLFEANYKSGILGDKITVGEYMSSWTDQAGYPLVHVTTNNEHNNIVVTQKRFQIDQNKVNDLALWHIGLTYTTKNKNAFNNVQPSIWMNNTETTITIPQSNNEGWIIFNLQSTGFYRVNYDSKNWDLLISELKLNPTTIHVLNRAQLIDDSFNLARAGELSYSVPLALTSYLEKENDFIPWYSVLNSMSYVVERLRRCPKTGQQMTELAKKYAGIAYKKVSNQYEKNDSEHLAKTSMNAFSNWACKLEVEECVNSALNYFNEWQKNSVEIPPDVKEAALCVGVKNGTEETWNKVYELFLNTPSTSERQAALLALACSRNGSILSNYLNRLLDANCPIRPQDYRTVFSSLASTPIGINITTDFLQKKINESLSSMWEGEEMVIQIYSIIASKVATNVEIHELNTIRNYTYLSPALKQSFDESYKEVELNSAYFDKAHPPIHDWFNPNTDSPTHSSSSVISNSFSHLNCIVLLLIFTTLLVNNNNILVN